MTSRPHGRKRVRGVHGAVIVGLIALVLGAGACASTTSNAKPRHNGSFSRLVDPASLPSAARDTLDRIARGGPFPYARDGVVFENREHLLPRHPRGWYHEYTVPTPGSSDRGARRIVVGRDGRVFYTDDHYQSFREVRGP